MIQSPSTLISTVASCLNCAQQMYDHIIIIIMYQSREDPVSVSAQNDTVDSRPLVGMRSGRYDVRH